MDLKPIAYLTFVNYFKDNLCYLFWGFSLLLCFVVERNLFEINYFAYRELFSGVFNEQFKFEQFFHIESQNDPLFKIIGIIH